MSEPSSPFTSRKTALLIGIGTLLFLLFLALTAYAPELRTGRDGRAHPLSTSAAGFRGIYDLLDAAGADVELLRENAVRREPGLTILTLQPEFDRERLEELTSEQWGSLLIVLPKWQTVPIPNQRDRVAAVQPGMGSTVVPALSSLVDITVGTSDVTPGSELSAGPMSRERFRAPRDLQTISGERLVSLMETAEDEYVLANIVNTRVYILADPDLLNNQVLADPRSARAAFDLVTELAEGEGPIRFDLVINGFGGSPNLLRLAFEPPFLALTLCLLGAALMVGWQATQRFGPTLREPRAIPFGKKVLVDNSADLLARAGREKAAAGRYAAFIRDRAVAATGNPGRLDGERLDHWLDGLTPVGSPSFSDLVHDVETAGTGDEMARAALALNRWRRTVTHED